MVRAFWTAAALAAAMMIGGCEPDDAARSERRPEIDEVKLRSEATRAARTKVTAGNARQQAEALERKIKAELH